MTEIAGYKAVDYGKATSSAAELGKLFNKEAPADSNNGTSEASKLLDLFKEAA